MGGAQNVVSLSLSIVSSSFCGLNFSVSYATTTAPQIHWPYTVSYTHLEALTAHGCNIRMRVGMHETGDGYCADDGVIMLQVCGDRETVEQMLADFNAVEGVTAKLIDLNEIDS